MAGYSFFQLRSPTAADASVSAIIVPHHDLVAQQRAATFERVAPRTQGRRIILLAPNHYNNGSAAVQTRSQDFSTRNGTVHIDQTLLKTVLAHGAVETRTTFEVEHGIKALLPDIARFYPQSALVPLVVSQQAKLDDLEQLLQSLHTACPDCLLVTSADFSHYQPYQLSELHDRLTLRGLMNRDGALLDTLAELEPMHHTWMTTKWAELQDTQRFVQDQHTNATEVTKDYYAEGTTHIMGWYERGEPVDPAANVSFTMAGPMYFDEQIYATFSPRFSALFDQLGDRVLWGTDMVLGSVPIASGGANVSSAMKALKQLRFSHLQTPAPDEYLLASGARRLENPTIITGHKQRVAVFSGQASEISVDEIRRHQQDNVIVYAKWGAAAQDQQKQLAHAWVDAGADIVIGTDKAAPKEAELYQNRPIVYSQGSFLSSTNPSNSSIVLVGEFTADKISLLPLLIRQDGFKPILQRSSTADAELAEVFADLKPFLVDERGGLLYSIPK